MSLTKSAFAGSASRQTQVAVAPPAEPPRFAATLLPMSAASALTSAAAAGMSAERSAVGSVSAAAAAGSSASKPERSTARVVITFGGGAGVGDADGAGVGGADVGGADGVGAPKLFSVCHLFTMAVERVARREALFHTTVLRRSLTSQNASF